jgi:gluconolactonase
MEDRMFEKVTPTVLASGFQSPEGPSFDWNGLLHFVDWDAQTIYRVTLDGEVTPFANTGGVPTGSKFQRNGHLFVADGEYGHERSRRIFAQLQGGLGPDGMAFAQDGNLYVAHFGKGVVAVINPEGQLIAELPVGGKKVTNVAFWAASLFVTEVERGQVVRLDIGVEGQALYGQS